MSDITTEEVIVSAPTPASNVRKVRILFVRHGERLDESDHTQWAAVRTQENWHDPPLTETGRQQAREAAHEVRKWLADRNCADKFTFFASPASRTLTTAVEVGTLLGTPPVTVVHGLYACTAAAFERGLHTLKLSCPKALLGDYPLRALHGTSADDYFQAMDQIASLIPLHQTTAVVVTHREGIRDVIKKAVGRRPRMPMPYCATHLFTAVESPAEESEEERSILKWDYHEQLYPLRKMAAQ
eukprot:Rhum_TRINITY_DN20627_c0_g1::Rhum_TRINITY_DN20627_c0_g1_i1::g.171586::m.171586